MFTSTKIESVYKSKKVIYTFTYTCLSVKILVSTTAEQYHKILYKYSCKSNDASQ